MPLISNILCPGGGAFEQVFWPRGEAFDCQNEKSQMSNARGFAREGGMDRFEIDQIITTLQYKCTYFAIITAFHSNLDLTQNTRSPYTLYPIWIGNNIGEKILVQKT